MVLNNHAQDGGDEIVVLMPFTDEQECSEIVRNIKRNACCKRKSYQATGSSGVCNDV